MNHFSISQMSRFSGVKAHTIRMWEKRYGALKPHRSEGNTRYYNNEQLRRLLNIVSLRDSEYKISELCVMSNQELFNKLERSRRVKIDDQLLECYVSQLIAAGISYHEDCFEEIYVSCRERYGMKKMYDSVIYPMLLRLGLMWKTDTLPPAHEHFISQLLQKKFWTAIDALPLAKSTAETWLLFLPEDEYHEVGLLFANYLIRQSGQKVIYLGANVPFASLKEATKATAADNLLLFLVRNNLSENVQDYLDHLHTQLAVSKIFLAGNQQLVDQLKLQSKFHRLQSADDLNRLLIS